MLHYDLSLDSSKMFSLNMMTEHPHFALLYIDCILIDKSPGKFIFAVDLSDHIYVQLILKYEGKYKKGPSFNYVKITLNNEEKFSLDGILADILRPFNRSPLQHMFH